jgi:hypothetical protein
VPRTSLPPGGLCSAGKWLSGSAAPSRPLDEKLGYPALGKLSVNYPYSDHQKDRKTRMKRVIYQDFSWIFYLRIFLEIAIVIPCYPQFLIEDGWYKKKSPTRLASPWVPL